jgi:hypothetical protein
LYFLSIAKAFIHFGLIFIIFAFSLTQIKAKTQSLITHLSIYHIFYV